MCSCLNKREWVDVSFLTDFYKKWNQITSTPLFCLSFPENKRITMSLIGDINAAYEDVRNDKTDTNWILLGYEDEKGDGIKLVSSGNFYNFNIKSIIKELED